MKLKNMLLGAALLAVASGPLHAATLPGIGTFEGVAGIGTSNGDVPNSPLGKNYVYVTTAGSTYTGAGLGLGGETNGSLFKTVNFIAAAGDKLDLYFNYITSDGTTSFIEYAYVLLNDIATGTSETLFTARTTPSGDTVPGFGLPPLAPGVTLNPASTPILDGLTKWAELGGSSGACFGLGCGQTGWVQALYNIGNAGEYSLTFGVVNWGDTALDSGLAVAGVKVGDVIIVDPVAAVPAPAAGLLLVGALGGLAALRRRKAA